MTTQISTFGFKMAWLAIKKADTEAIIKALHLSNVQIIDWTEGITNIYEKNGNPDAIFITPQINGWSFVVGWYFFDLDSRDGKPKRLKDYIVKLSSIFGEVQAFATHRVSEYHHWMLAKNGKIERCFAYSGTSGEILSNEGELTDAEKQFPWDKLKTFHWFPDEEDVLNIAEKWSLNPTKIDDLKLNNSICYLAKIPSITHLNFS